jgi:hypothetical protein
MVLLILASVTTARILILIEPSANSTNGDLLVTIGSIGTIITIFAIGDNSVKFESIMDLHWIIIVTNYSTTSGLFPPILCLSYEWGLQKVSNGSPSSSLVSVVLIIIELLMASLSHCCYLITIVAIGCHLQLALAQLAVVRTFALLRDPLRMRVSRCCETEIGFQQKYWNMVWHSQIIRNSNRFITI